VRPRNTKAGSIKLFNSPRTVIRKDGVSETWWVWTKNVPPLVVLSSLWCGQKKTLAKRLLAACDYCVWHDRNSPLEHIFRCIQIQGSLKQWIIKMEFKIQVVIHL
jgi:hypothetical protein